MLKRLLSRNQDQHNWSCVDMTTLKAFRKEQSILNPNALLIKHSSIPLTECNLSFLETPLLCVCVFIFLFTHMFFSTGD